MEKMKKNVLVAHKTTRFFALAIPKMTFIIAIKHLKDDALYGDRTNIVYCGL